jgi:hypothetical protein
MNHKYFAILFIPLSLLLIFVALVSLKWHMVHDAPLMLYLAYLMDYFHYVPYRDFFDMNLPGTYFINLLIGRLLGYSDFGFRCADILYLNAILTITFFILKKLGWKIAWCGTVLFGIYYLGHGANMSMQREYLILLPISAAILCALSFPKLNSIVKCFIIGFLLGLASTIKPYAAISLPLVLLFQLLDIRERNNNTSLSSGVLLTVLSFSIIGFVIPIGAMFAYLWLTGALPYFWDMVVNYWPLYRDIGPNRTMYTGLSNIAATSIKQYRDFLRPNALEIIPSVFGVFIALLHSTLTAVQKRRVLLLIGLAFCYFIYPVFNGQFYTYHFLIFFYFNILLSSLCLVEKPKEAKRIERLFPVAILMLYIFVGLGLLQPVTFWSPIVGNSMEPPKGGMVDEMAIYLKSHMKTGDKVQPLDNTGGAVHAMLIAKVQIATPFYQDFHFYHHISKPYIQNLRKRFIRNLETSSPRFIIQVLWGKPWLSGLDTTRKFEELQNILATDYTIACRGTGYFVIYERRCKEKNIASYK